MTATSEIKQVLDVYINGTYIRSFTTDKILDEFVRNWFNSELSKDTDEIEVKTVYRRYYCE